MGLELFTHQGRLLYLWYPSYSGLLHQGCRLWVDHVLPLLPVSMCHLLYISSYGRAVLLVVVLVCLSEEGSSGFSYSSISILSPPLLFLLRNQTFWIIHSSLTCNVVFSSGKLSRVFYVISVSVILIMAVPMNILLCIYLSWSFLNFLQVNVFYPIEWVFGHYSFIQIFFCL